MKKLLAYIMTAVLVLFSLAGCGEEETKDLSCNDIISAYEKAGYYVVHGAHNDEGSQQCYIKASISDEDDSDYIYFITCFTEEQAKEAYETDKYNVLIWLYGTVCGESRWLKTGVYGKIEYSYYNSDLIAPFNELIE